MAQNNNINFKLNFEMGDKKAFDSFKKELNEIKALASSADLAIDPVQMQKTISAANTLEQALKRAYDPKLNVTNVQKFNKVLADSGMNIKTLQTDLAAVGPVGEKAFLKATTQLMNFGTAVKQTNAFLDNIANTLFNTVKYTAFNNILSSISSTVSHSYGYVKDLDRSLNDIRIVTNKSAEDMAEFATQANNAAKALAVTTSDYTEGSLIYYQQGLDDETVKTLTDITAKTSNVTQQSMSTVSEQLTAVWNGYQVANQAAEEGMQVYEEYVDKMAAVGASTASDLEELSTAMSKVASAASSMGVGFDDLNAQIATIVSVTRQAPESVGTALKTIYARLGDLKVDGVDEFGTKLGEVSAQLQTMGINILDQQGNMRDMSGVIAEVAEKLDTWTSAQRQAAAVAMAGKRQYNNLIALFDNLDKYGEALETSMNAAGTLEQQQEIALESLTSKIKVLKATAEDLYDSLFNTDTIGSFIETGTGVLQFFADFTDSIGGLNNLLPMLGSLGINVFSNQIANGLATIIQNARTVNSELTTMQSNQEALQSMYINSGFISSDANANTATGQTLRELLSYYQEMFQYQGSMSKEQKEQYKNILDMKEAAGSLTSELMQQIDAYETKYKLIKSIDTEVVNEIDNNEKLSSELYRINTIVQEISKSYDADASEGAFESIVEKLKIAGTISKDAAKQMNALFKSDYIKAGENVNEALGTMIDRFAGARDALQEMANQKGHIDSLNDSFKHLGDSFKEQIQLENHINNITKAVGAMGQLAMSINTIKNIGSILNNDDIDTGDKLLQTIMNISFVLPNLINGISNLEKVFGVSSSILNVVTTAIAKTTAATKAHTLASQIDNVLNTKQNVSYYQNAKAVFNKMTAEEKELFLQGKLNVTRVTGNALIEEEYMALEALIKQEVTETKVKETETAANNALNSSLLASPVGWVVLGLTALVATIALVTAAQEKQLEQTAELAQKDIERANAIQAEVDGNKDLVNSYMDLYKASKQQKVSKEDMADVTQQLCDKYDIEISKLKELKGDYDEFTESIKKARIAELEEAKIASEDEIKAAESRLYTTSKIGGKKRGYETSSGGYQLMLSSGADTRDEEEIAKIIQRNGLFGDIYAHEYDSYTQGIKDRLSTSIATGISDINNPQQMVELYENLVQLKREIESEVTDASTRNNSEYYTQISELIERMTPEIEEYKSALEDLDKYNAQLAALQIDFSGIQTLTEYKTKLYQLKDALVETGKSEEEALKLAKIYAAEQGDVAKSWADQYDILGEVSDITKIELEKLQNWLENLSEDKKQLVLSGKVDFNGLRTADEIEKAIKIIQEKVDSEDLHVVVSLREKLASDKKLTKTQIKEAAGETSTLAQDYEVTLSDFDNQSQLKQVETLNDIANEKILINKNYIAQAQKAAEEEKALEEKKKTALEEELRLLKYRNDVYKDLTDEEKNRLEELKEIIPEIEDKIVDLNNIAENGLSFEEIDDLNFDNFIAGIEGITSKAEVLKSLAEDVGENLTIAAEDIERFGKNFPELLDAQENYNFLQDGSLQLTKEGQAAFQEMLEARKAELIASNESYQIELQKQADVQKATAEYYENQAQLLKDYLAGNQSAAKTETALKEGVYNYTKALAEATGQDQEELTKIIEENYDKAAETNMLDAQDIYDNYVALGRVAAAASQAYLSKEFVDPGIRPGGGGGHSQGASSFSSSRDVDSGKYLKNLSDEEIQQMIDAAETAGEKARNRYSDYISKIAGLGGSVNSAIKAMDGAASGKGGKESKSKSGSSKKDKDKDEKELEDEFDRYWEIKKAIDAVDQALKKLDKDKENLYGYELINALKQENELLEQQAANYNTLYEMQQQEAAELREQLGTMGLMFDASGAITNYAAATSAALAQYSAAIEQYNAGLIDETTLKVYEKAYENFKKLLERYDKLYYTEMQQTQEKLDEIRRKELANNLKAWEVEIQIHLDKEKMKRELNDFLKDIEQDFKKVYSNLRIDVKYDEKNFKSLVNDVYTTTKAIQDVEAEIDKMMAGGTSTMFESVSQAQEKLKELQDQLIDQGKALYELYKQVWDAYLKGIDQVKDQFDELMKRYQKFDDELEYHKELIELLYGDKAYDLMDKYYSAQTKNVEAQINSMRKQAEYLETEFSKSFNFALSLGSDVDLNDFTTLTEDMKKAYENMIEAQGNLNDLVLEGVKILQDQYLNSINKIIDTMNQGLLGTSMEKMKKDWEFQKEVSDLFLDNTQKAYKLQNFSNKIAQDISNSSSLKAQEKLQAFRERELDYLENKKNLTQEDIELAEMRYQIALKEIALEDAQNNKTSMKLTRNEQGNWSYQYVADEDDTAQKQQDLMTSLGEYYERALQYSRDGGDAIIELTEKMQEELAEALLKSEGDMEIYKQREQEIYEKYRPIIEALIDNTAVYEREALIVTSEIFGRLCEDDATAYEKLTDEQQRMVNELKEVTEGDFSDLRDKIIDGFYPDLESIAKEVFENTAKISNATVLQMVQELATDKTSFRQVILSAIDDLIKATQNYEKELDKLEEISGKDFDNIEKNIDEVINKIDEMEGTTEKMVDNSSDYLDELRRVLKAVADAWNDVIDQILESQKQMQKYLDLMAAARAAANAPTNTGGTGSSPSPGGGNGGGNGGNNSTGTDDDHFVRTETSPTANGQLYERDILSKNGKEYVKEIRGPFGGNTKYYVVHDMTGHTHIATSKDQANQIVENLLTQGIKSSVQGPLSAEELKKTGLLPMKTGGYTGTLNNGDSDGRLAVLHQKELVLNADDTENFLTGVRIMREMTNLNGSIADTITTAVANMIVELTHQHATVLKEQIQPRTEGGNIFNITAEFPNANDVVEIREAILGLPTLASQYVAQNQL